jgi:hypothetical protein
MHRHFFQFVTAFHNELSPMKLVLMGTVLVALMPLCGCVGPFGWRSDPPWLTPYMDEDELVSELAAHIPLGASRAVVLKNLDRRGVKPFAEIADDGGFGAEWFLAAKGEVFPQFSVEAEHHVFPYLNQNYFVVRQNHIAVLVVVYRAKPPVSTFVQWAKSFGSEVIIRFDGDQVSSVQMRPLEDETSQSQSPHFKIESLR